MELIRRPLNILRFVKTNLPRYPPLAGICFRSLTSFRTVPCSTSFMPTAIQRRPYSDTMSSYYSSLDAPMKSVSPMLTFEDNNILASPESDQMLFGPLDFEDFALPSSPPAPAHWDIMHDLDNDVKPMYDFSSSPLSPNYGIDVSQSSPTDSGYYDSAESYGMRIMKNSPPPDSHLFLSNWINDPELSMSSPSSPIPIPTSSSIPQSSSFIAFAEPIPFPRMGVFSPTEYAALHPLPRSMSPPSSFEDHYSPIRQRMDSISPQDTSLHTPSWASQLWDTPSAIRSPSFSRPSVRHSPLSDTTVRQRVPSYRGSISSGQLFQSSSAPTEPRVPNMTRSYSRRAESVSVNDDHDATVRRKKRSPPVEDPTTTAKVNDNRQYHT